MSKVKYSFKIRKSIIVLISLLVISMFFLAFSAGGFVVNFKEAGFSAVSTLQKGIHSISSFFSDTVTAVRELSDLKENYDTLLKQMEKYEELQRTSVDIKKENQTLKDLLSFSQDLTAKNIVCEVIAKDPDAMYNGITINKGAKQGIKKDMPVIAFQNGTTGLVGKIIQVSRSTSMIMPIYDYQCFVSARLEKTRYEGLMNGNGTVENNLSIRYVKKRAKEELEYGDRVITTGDGYNYPKDVAIGTISKIKSPDYETSLELEVEPAIDFTRLEYVFVLDMDSLKELD